MFKKIQINEDLIKIIISILLFLLSFVLNKVELPILILSYIIVSYDMYINAFKKIKEKDFFDEDILMIVATLGAFFIQEYEEAVIVMILFELGEYLSDLAVDNSKREITKLIDLRSDFVVVKDKFKEKKYDIKKVKLGDIFIVKPGEKIPLDGLIISGDSNIDTSSLTGESIPKHVISGDSVLSGTVNLDSVIEVRATSIYKTSTASKIIEIIESSNDKKTKTEKFITRFSKIYTPVVILLALIICIIPWILGGNFNEWMYKSLEFLVISCPCALVISVPLGFFLGIGRASKEGILIKGSNELDHLSDIKAILFDKTGTLTKGSFEVSKICPSKETNSEDLLKLVACCESLSNHPIAKSILRKYGKNIDNTTIKDFTEISGKGIICKIGKDKVYIGTKDLLNDNKIECEVHKNEIGTVVYVTKNKKYLGHILITDVIKKEAYNLINDLNAIGINRLIMLSGDDINIVEKVGKEINFKEYYANLLPHEKVDKLKEIQNELFTAFVGDGINDAPVIKLSDIGISMGGIGSDAAINASDIVLMKDDLNCIPKAIRISKYTKRIVISNIIFAISFKVLIMVLALLGITSLWIAVFADVGVTLLAVINTFRILFTKKV